MIGKAPQNGNPFPAARRNSRQEKVMNFFKLARKVQKEEDGAVTVDWVVLTAAIVVLAAGIGAVLVPKVNKAADNIGTYLGTKTSSIASGENNTVPQ